MLKTFTKKLYPFSVFLCILTEAFSQGTVISGSVADADTGEPLIGVNILVKGKVLGTITDVNGDFRLGISDPPPVTLVFSIVGYATQDVEIEDENITDLNVRLTEKLLSLGQEIVVSASRVQESFLQSPVSIEKLDILDVRNAASPSFYDEITNIKGVDFSTQSLTHKTINTRGFAANGNLRFVQLIDGIDNQAPGLNFPVGNIVGISDLDLESAELIPGAASALYGPNALNGILLLTSKSPFEYQGVSASARVGMNHVDEEDDDLAAFQKYAFRYARAINDKFAFKVVVDYTRAEDWVAVDTRDQSFLVEVGETERGDNRVYDGVNVYGEPLVTIGAIADLTIAQGQAPDATPEEQATAEQLMAIRTLLPDGASGAFTPTGFPESSFVDNTTESLKVGAALHYRITDDIEGLVQYNRGSGSTVYTANDRFVLDDFSIWTAKGEIRGSNFFLRGYTTQEDAGDSYAANTIASLINQQTFIPAYFETFAAARTGALSAGNQPMSIEASHALARVAAEANQATPGTQEFNQIFNTLRDLPISQGGAKFLDKSNLFHAEGMYNFVNQLDFAEIIVGGNFRRYDLNSEGTLFALENDGDEINIDEFGAYTQVTKNLINDNLRVSASFRFDKNENFDGQFSPRVSAVYTILEDHNIRASFQRAFRIPTTQDQFIDLDVVTRRLVGSDPLLVDRYNFRTNTVYTTNSVNEARNILQETGDITQAISLLEPVMFEDFETEKLNTFEVGYKSLIDDRLLIDAYYYFSSYNDFIAEIDFTQAVPNGLRNPGPANPESDEAKEAIVTQTVPAQRFGFDVNADGNVQAQGWALGSEYRLPNGYRVKGNVAWNELIDQDDLIEQGFRASYNTPEWRTNLTLANRDVIENLGFSITWRWQDAFLWESSFGTGVIPDYHTLDAQVSYKLTDFKTIVKLGGTNITNERFTTSFGNPRIGALYYISLTFDEFLN